MLSTLGFKKLLLFIFCFSILRFSTLTSEFIFAAQPNDDHIKKIIIRSQIEHIAQDLEKKGLYEEAIAKYQEALDPSLINYEADKCMANGGIRNIHQKQGKLELAFQETQWFLSLNPNKSEYLDKKAELDALIKTKETNSTEPIYQYIDYLKQKYHKQLPPHACDSWASARIIYAYDYVGDYEAGVQFAEEALKYWKKIGPGNPYQLGNPYFQVKQAFEQDRKDGFKGCLDAKPGEVCMGRATQALIQSDYFPW